MSLISGGKKRFQHKRASKKASVASSVQPSGESLAVTQELYRKNLELAHTNRTLSLLRIIDSLVLDTNNGLSEVASGITQAMMANSSYAFCGIYLYKSHHSISPEPVSISFEQSSTDADSQAMVFNTTNLIVKDAWFKGSETSRFVGPDRVGKAFLDEIFPKKTNPDVAELFFKNAKTILLLKLKTRRSLVGLMLIGMNDGSDSVKIEDIAQLGRLGEATGLALDNRLLYEENQTVLRQLRQSNQKLKALDEAKDEFISMASHQLRTPLTSVKGYMSMVLEGDVGKISSQQREMLEQAYASSQRMVYLIADLLNVSRLKTGKFVIETAPVYLPDIVETEIQQLKEAAKVHNLELVFTKPETFPTLNLDETKTRQVIMNFMDNAIYYTPAGGHIRVELSANDKTVDYKVIDDGLGVPKEEQHHLFTKFFRAGNAKKARPDGTGLGLFMAKKVIAAQGGTIIFKSEEGKGSTFGFSFPRPDLEVK